MAMQGPDAAAAARLQAADDDDFAGFSDHYDEQRQPGGPSQSGSDSEDFIDSTGDLATFDPIPEARYQRFGPSDTIQELQAEFNEWAKGRGFAVNRHNARNRQGPDKEYSRYDFYCDRYGLPRPLRSTGLR
jgi:hypothetical protein